MPQKVQKRPAAAVSKQKAAAKPKAEAKPPPQKKLKAAAKPLLKKAAGAIAKKAAANAAGRVADKVVPPQANKGMKVKKKGKIRDASGKVVGKYKNRGKIGKALTGQDVKASFKEGGKYDPRKEAMKKGLEAKIKKAKGTPAAKPLVQQYRKLTGSK